MQRVQISPWIRAWHRSRYFRFVFELREIFVEGYAIWFRVNRGMGTPRLRYVVDGSLIPGLRSQCHTPHGRRNNYDADHSR